MKRIIFHIIPILSLMKPMVNPAVRSMTGMYSQTGCHYSIILPPGHWWPHIVHLAVTIRACQIDAWQLPENYGMRTAISLRIILILLLNKCLQRARKCLLLFSYLFQQKKKNTPGDFSNYYGLRLTDQ